MPVVVANKSSFQVANELVQLGYNPLILDMANISSVGGSVLRPNGLRLDAFSQLY